MMTIDSFIASEASDFPKLRRKIRFASRRLLRSPKGSMFLQNVEATEISMVATQCGNTRELTFSALSHLFEAIWKIKYAHSVSFSRRHTARKESAGLL